MSIQLDKVETADCLTRRDYQLCDAPVAEIVDPTTGEVIPPPKVGPTFGPPFQTPPVGGTTITDTTVTTTPETQLRCIEILLSPTYGFTEAGKSWQFRAVLRYSDETTVDITSNAKWLSSQPGVFSIGQTTGLGTGVAAGIATISANYCNITGYAQMQVEAVCIATPLDIVIVLDRSYSMHDIENPGIERIEAARDAAIGLVGVVDFSRDKVALVSFAGEYIMGPPIQTIRDSRLDYELSNNKASLIDAINDKFVIKDPYCLNPYGAQANIGAGCVHMQGATGIGAGFEEAVNELASGRHSSNARKVIVLISDGVNNISVPSPATVSAAAKESGIIIVIAALGIESYNHDILRTYGTPGLYFAVDDGAGLSDVLSRVPYIICTGYGSYGYGYSSGDPGPGGPAGSLHGLRWEMPCNVLLENNRGCTCVDPPDHYALMGGAVDQLYDVTLRIRGKVELKRYKGGTHNNAHLNIGGLPSNIDDALYNEYSLIVSDPPQTFWLNRYPSILSYLDDPDGYLDPEKNWDQRRGEAWAAECPVSCQSRVWVVDYEFVAQIRQGATATLRAKSIDSKQLVDLSGEKIAPDIIPYPAWYRGQHLQMDVTGISP